MMNDRTALLPTGTRMNPLNPEDAEYFDEGQVAYVLHKQGDTGGGAKKVVATSFGELRGFGLDTWHEVEHDQTNAFLGSYVVAAIVDFASSQWVGDVKDKARPHYVFK